MNVKRCPDGATCHHGCGVICWRVNGAGPLSGVYPGDQWPAEVVAEHVDGRTTQVINPVEQVVADIVRREANP